MFRAYQPEQDRLVAVKLFRLDLPPERAHQLVAEFQQLIDSDLAHSFIAAPLATGLVGVHAYLAQDFVAAESLDVLIRDSGPASVETITRVALQLGHALDHAAAAHILHGALHPRDILTSADDARMTGLGLTRALAQVGVPAPVRRPYTAPERIAGLPWDQRADVFSLGALLFELVSGRRVSGVGEEAANTLPEVLAAGDRRLLRPVFARALAGNPAARYESGVALAQALVEALSNDKAAIRRESVKRRKFGADTPGLLPELVSGAASESPTVASGAPTPPVVSTPGPTPQPSRLARAEARVRERKAADSRPEASLPPVLRSSESESAAHQGSESEAAGSRPSAEAPSATAEVSRPEPAAPSRRSSKSEGGSPETPSPRGARSEPPADVRDDGRHDLGDLHLGPAPLDRDPLDLHLVAEPALLPLDEPIRAADPVTPFVPEPEMSLEPAIGPATVTGVHSGEAIGESAIFETPSRYQEPEQTDRDPDHLRSREPRPSPFLSHATEAEPTPLQSSMWPLVAALVVGIGIGFGFAVAFMGREPVPAQQTAAQSAPAVIIEPPLVSPDAPPVTRPVPRTPAPGDAGATRPSTDPTTVAPPKPAENDPPAVPRLDPRSAPAGAPSPPTPRAAAPSALPGRLLVRSTPAGATVFVDGKEAGLTPLTFRNVAAGAHTVRVTHPGYAPVERRVLVTDARPAQTLTIELERSRSERRPTAGDGQGVLIIESRPTGARVVIDGKAVGTTPLVLQSVTSGDHKVQLDLVSFRRWASEVNVVAGERTRVAASLEK